MSKDLKMYPLVICYIAIEHGPVEIVDLPIGNGGPFHSYVNVYQRVFAAQPKWLRPVFKHGGVVPEKKTSHPS